MVRFWSSGAARSRGSPAPRGGVAPERGASAAISCGEQTRPSSPAQRTARPAAGLVEPASPDAGAGQVVRIEAREHRDAEQPGAAPASASASTAAPSIARPPAACRVSMAGASSAGRADRAGHRVRDVVQLEVEEQRQPELRPRPARLRAVGGEELEPELEPAHRAARARASATAPVRSGRSMAQNTGLAIPAHEGEPDGRAAAGAL